MTVGNVAKICIASLYSTIYRTKLGNKVLLINLEASDSGLSILSNALALKGASERHSKSRESILGKLVKPFGRFE